MGWRDSSRPFNELAEEYDAWFDNNPLFDLELKALHAIREKLPRPSLEIGVGPGRFARALEVDYGIDPAISPLQLATRRSIMGIHGVGESIPFLTASMGTVYMLFTLCFLEDSGRVLKECSRIIRPHGRLIIGMIPRLSAWGKLLSDKGRKGHPCYHHARFRTIAETREMLAQNGFAVIESWSTLLQSPDTPGVDESPRFGINEDAGFCVLVTCKEETVSETTQSDYPDD
jgi:SAM-dependent methyltransferase